MGKVLTSSFSAPSLRLNVISPPIRGQAQPRESPTAWFYKLRKPQHSPRSFEDKREPRKLFSYQLIYHPLSLNQIN